MIKGRIQVQASDPQKNLQAEPMKVTLSQAQ
jgi:hypothetical protein